MSRSLSQGLRSLVGRSARHRATASSTIREVATGAAHSQALQTEKVLSRDKNLRRFYSSWSSSFTAPAAAGATTSSSSIPSSTTPNQTKNARDIIGHHHQQRRSFLTGNSPASSSTCPPDGAVARALQASERTFRLSRTSNGMRVASLNAVSDSTVTVGVWIDAGSRYETRESNGAAHFLEHMTFKGTKRRTRHQLETEIENIGGHLNAYTSREQTVYYAKVFPDDLMQALDILSDILGKSSIHHRSVEDERSVITREMEEVEKSVEEVIFDRLHLAAFRDHMLGATILGPVENIHHLQQHHLKDYVENNYTTDRMVVIACGAVDHDKLVTAVEQYFQDFRTEPLGFTPYTQPEWMQRQRIGTSGTKYSFDPLGTGVSEEGGPGGKDSNAIKTSSPPLSSEERARFGATTATGQQESLSDPAPAKPRFWGAELLYKTPLGEKTSLQSHNPEQAAASQLAHFAIAFEGVSWTSPDAVHFMLLQSLLGVFKRDESQKLLPGVFSANPLIRAVTSRLEQTLLRKLIECGPATIQKPELVVPVTAEGANAAGTDELTASAVSDASSDLAAGSSTTTSSAAASDDRKNVSSNSSSSTGNGTLSTSATSSSEEQGAIPYYEKYAGMPVDEALSQMEEGEIAQFQHDRYAVLQSQDPTFQPAVCEQFSAFNTCYRDTGLFGMHAACSADAVRPVVEELMYGINRLSHSVTADEVDRAKRELKTILFASQDNTTNIAEEIGRHLLVYGRRIPPAEMDARLSAITVDDVKRVARQYLHGNEISVTALGPIDDMPSLGEIKRMNSMNFE
ncbi:unnamed protein product [Amoebophrya sp. A25]|nr:unnamed protein product [Amoebophrya sp. A25]|eukprot:GSA25T00011510001.1